MIKNYTTKIPPEKTIAEIQGKLVKNGARELSFGYDESGNLRRLTFQMVFHNQPIFFEIAPPINGVLAVLKKDGAAKNLLTYEHATRVAWRIEKDWLEAQLAKIEAGLATPVQLLLPYVVMNGGRTFFEKFESGISGLLE